MPAKELADDVIRSNGNDAYGEIESADDFFRMAATPLLEAVYIPEAQKVIYVRALTSRELLRLQRANDRVTKQNRRNPAAVDLSDQDFNARVVMVCACNKDGEPIFKTEEHRRQLSDVSTPYTLPIAKAAFRVSGIDTTSEERKDAKEDFDETRNAG